jgi:hypothetical protein
MVEYCQTLPPGKKEAWENFVERSFLQVHSQAPSLVLLVYPSVRYSFREGNGQYRDGGSLTHRSFLQRVGHSLLLHHDLVLFVPLTKLSNRRYGLGVLAFSCVPVPTGLLARVSFLESSSRAAWCCLRLVRWSAELDGPERDELTLEH